MTLPSPYAPSLGRVQGRRLRGRVRQLAWASVPVWSLGMLAFVPFLRLAFVRRQGRDWGVFAAYFAVVIGLVVLVSAGGSKGAASAVAGGVVILLMGFAAVHAAQDGGFVAYL